MEIKVTKSTGSPSADRKLLIEGGFRDANDDWENPACGILLRTYRNALVLLTAENREYLKLDKEDGDGSHWKWRFPLRALYRLDWDEVLPEYSGRPFTLWRKKAYGCTFERSFVGPFLLDTSPRYHWQWMYDDLDSIVKGQMRRRGEDELVLFPTPLELVRYSSF